jgi:hypothetical protein
MEIDRNHLGIGLDQVKDGSVRQAKGMEFGLQDQGAGGDMDFLQRIYIGCEAKAAASDQWLPFVAEMVRHLGQDVWRGNVVAGRLGDILNQAEVLKIEISQLLASNRATICLTRDQQ